MTRDVISIGPRASVREAIRLLEDCDIRHLPVTDGQRLLGIVSDRDLREYRIPVELEIERFDEQIGERVNEIFATPVVEAMNANVLSVDTEESIHAALDVMIQYKVGALPVIDRHTEDLVGIVSYVDVLRYARQVMGEH